MVGADIQMRKLKIDCIIFSLDDCAVCAALQNVVNSVIKASSNSNLKQRLDIHIWHYGDPCTFPPAAMVRPRLLPTLIAFKDGVARLGWEGFAAMAPSEIQADIVREVLEQAAALADEPIEGDDANAQSEAS